jgi:hypothetical protein
MTSPPGKGTGALLHAPISKLTGLGEVNSVSGFTQACEHPVTRTERLRDSHPPVSGQEKYGARYNLLRFVQKPFFDIGWRIERECARIETAHELAKWNRANERCA